MAVKKQNSYISFELEWMEKKFKQFQIALDNYDLEKLEDRYGPKELPNGKVVDAIISSKEDQLKTVMFILEKLPKVVASLDELRAKEAEKMEARGDVAVNVRMLKD